MTSAEIAVVIFGSLFGFGIVSAFIAGKKAPSTHDNPDHSTSSGGNSYQGSNPKDRYDSGYTDPADSNALKEWHLVLQVERSATLEQVKDAYRRRMLEYHPDKVARLGLDLRMLAEKKSKEINAAFKQAVDYLKIR
jgi:DnaJ-domain-containing protein 1